MKLFEILLEAPGEYVVYKITAPGSNAAYYGYNEYDMAHPDADANLKRAVVSAASRTNDAGDAKRGTSKMADLAGGVDGIIITPIESWSSEYEAFMQRNDERARDPDSITQPSRWPDGMWKRMLIDNPERRKQWSAKGNVNTMKARAAMDAGAMSYADDLVPLVQANPKIKAELTKDLDRMLFPEFKAKYLP